MLSTAVESYLAARRAAGYHLKDHEGILRDFARFASAKAEDWVRIQTVLEWVRAGGASPLRRCVRLRTVVHFARYLQAEDERHEVPPEHACGRHRPRRRPPFLFTPQEVEVLVREARTRGPVGTSEALNLRLADVTSDGLVVRHTKFGKNRLLPLHHTTKKALDQYLERRYQEAGVCSVRGRQLHANTVRHVFRRLVRALGIARDADRPRPRLHDLRFYFANQVLTHGPADPRGVARHMVALTTYLGHSDARNGYWYLEATPKLLSRIAERCEDFVNGGVR